MLPHGCARDGELTARPPVADGWVKGGLSCDVDVDDRSDDEDEGLWIGSETILCVRTPKRFEGARACPKSACSRGHFGEKVSRLFEGPVGTASLLKITLPHDFIVSRVVG